MKAKKVQKITIELSNEDIDLMNHLVAYAKDGLDKSGEPKDEEIIQRHKNLKSFIKSLEVVLK